MFQVGDIITGTLNSPYKITNSFGEYLVIETGVKTGINSPFYGKRCIRVKVLESGLDKMWNGYTFIVLPEHFTKVKRKDNFRR